MGFWTGVTTVANAIGAVMNLRGTPGAPPAPSLVAQKRGYLLQSRAGYSSKLQLI